MPLEFEPTRAAALQRLAAVRPAEYARSRNAIEGGVTKLSPYISHGLLTLPEVYADVATRHPLQLRDKFVYELGWREYFHHVWQHRGDAIFASLHDGPLPDGAYATAVPADVRQARTGVPAIDQAVRALYATGYLHNHARMWLASYLVHLRKVHWRSGADWLYGHLFDGDLASNHLSWQWVAGTGSSKPYLFNAENVARFAPPAWHSPGTVIDRGYEALDALARSEQAVAGEARDEGVAEPPLSTQPPQSWPELDADALAGRDVWLIHPWALRAPPADLPADTLVLAASPAAFHSQWPWSERRWNFVTEGSAALGLQIGFVSVDSLAAARSVQAVADPHLQPCLQSLPVRWHAAPRLFAQPAQACTSFSKWWAQATACVEALASQRLPQREQDLIRRLGH